MPRNHTLLPWRSYHRVSTADMAPDAVDSSIPPRLPPDVEPCDDAPAARGEGAGCFVWPLVSAGAVLLCALVAHWAAR